jgi:hypothetical protein
MEILVEGETAFLLHFGWGISPPFSKPRKISLHSSAEDWFHPHQTGSDIFKTDVNLQLNMGEMRPSGRKEFYLWARGVTGSLKNVIADCFPCVCSKIVMVMSHRVPNMTAAAKGSETSPEDKLDSCSLFCTC